MLAVQPLTNLVLVLPGDPELSRDNCCKEDTRTLLGVWAKGEERALVRTKIGKERRGKKVNQQYYLKLV